MPAPDVHPSRPSRHDPPGRPQAGWPGPLGTTLLLGGALGALVLSGRAWVSGVVVDPVLGPVQTTVAGSDAAPLVPAAALLALAAVLAVVLTRGWSRRVALVLAVLAGVGLVLASSAVLTDPVAVLRTSAAAGAGGALGAVDSAAVTWAPWACVAAAVALLSGAAIRWRPDPANQAHRPATPATTLPAAEVERRRNAQDWDRLSGGEDPTEHP